MEMGVKLGGGGGGGGRVGTIGVIEEDMGDGMQCSEHPYRNNPGGICAFCLQEKLGKLVSSSSPLPIHPFPSSTSPGSSSPSFRSEVNVGVGASVSVHATNGSSNSNGSFGSTSSSSKPNKLGLEYDQFHTKRAKIPFLLIKKKKKTSVHGGSDRANSSTVVTFKRSKSTVTPRRSGRFLEDEESFSPRKRNGFWSFLSLSSSSRLNGHGGSSSMKKADREKDCALQEPKMAVPINNGVCMKKKVEIFEEDDMTRDPNCHVSTAVPSFERRVSRSRSVGCGSRSFSGDFFERISTGFGDCTLRRVESQREGKQKVAPSSSSAVYGGAGYDPHHHHNSNIHHHGQQFIKERVKCGGIFSGFMMASSATSSICSSSSTYWVNASSNNEDVVAVKSSSSGFRSSSSSSSNNNNGRNPNKSSWSWAFASPMRAFGKTSSSSSKENGKKDVNKNTSPNLDSIPSLLTVSS